MSAARPQPAPRWLPGGHAATLYALLRRGPLPDYRRQRIDTPDGDFIDLDFCGTQDARRPLLALFHGLEGSSRSHYARALMRAVAARGWRGVVVHFRGCSGTPNRLLRAYHAGDSEEIDWLLQRLRAHAGHAPLFAVGVSLGGNALMKWLGESGAAADSRVQAAAAVCAPLDLRLCGDALGRGTNRLYSAHFLATLRAKARAKHRQAPDAFHLEKVLQARTLRAFDDAFTAPVHGFRDVEDYWQRASARPWLGAIRVPTWVLAARDDPFVPPAAWPDARSLGASRVRFEVLPRGGHVGFVSGPWPGHIDWLPRYLLERFAAGPAAYSAGGT